MSTNSPSEQLLVERRHWVNTLVGVLDTAFWLTDTEQYETARIVTNLLDWLNVPDRGPAQSVPAALATEVRSGFYAVALAGPRASGLRRAPRRAGAGDVVVSVDAWRYALVGMLSTAYPDLSPTELIGASKVIDDLLTALGLPERAAVCFPDEVVRAYHELGA